MRYRNGFLALALLAGSTLGLSVANAATITGPYVSGSAGYDLTQTQHGHFSPGSGADGFGSNAGGSAKFRHQNGYTGNVSLGYGFGNGLRAEVEGDYFYSQINHVNGNAAPGKTYGGDRNYGALVNVLYDIDLNKHFGLNVPFTPYVGVGAGYLWSSLHDTSTHYANGSMTSWNGTRGGFAYQGIVGVAYDITDVPGLAVTADYRMVGQDFYNGAFESHTGGRSGHVNFDPRFNHQFSIGLRYAFNSAPPPPQEEVPPATMLPIPAPARTYLVFFGFDSTTIQARAQNIINSAADAIHSTKVVRIRVNGYSDSSSIHGGERGAAYNLKLSERRADAVKAELIRDGVPADEIVVKGFGDKNPLIPTGPNAREPQNRRVEIIL